MISEQVLQAQVSQFADKYKLPSLLCGVSVGREIIAVGSSGFLDLGTQASPTKSSQYRIASMTKSFTAAAALCLRDEGKLEFDQPAASYGVPIQFPETSVPVTVFQLLTMQSGLPTDDAWADRRLGMPVEELSELIAEGFHFAHPPGVMMQYSNLGYALLGRVIRNCAGISCQEYISTKLLEPLGMERTTWVPNEQVPYAQPYRAGGSGTLEKFYGDGEIAPMGGLWSTLEDLFTWMNFFLDESLPGPLSIAARREQQRLQVEAPQRPLQTQIPYGFGLVATSERHGQECSHTGGLPGYGSNMRWNFEHKIGVAALANATYAPVSRLTASVIEQVNDTKDVYPFVGSKKSVEAIVEKAISLITSWIADDDAETFSNGILSENVLLDIPCVERKKSLQKVFGCSTAVDVLSVIYRSNADVLLVLESAQGVGNVRVMLTPHESPLVCSIDIVR